MDDFANTGLRTLLFAKSDLTGRDLNNIHDCDPSFIENQLTLLGTTGLEDLLADDVEECIQDFKEADIKVWMLTGDKGETAKNVGISCGIIDQRK